MKTKMKFSDIAGMLERDEMKEIVGGSGYTYSGGSGGGSNFVSGTALGGGGSSFGGANFNYSGGGMGGGLSSNYGPSNSSYGNSNYGSSSSASSSSSWYATASGMSTSNALDISRLFEYLTGQSNGQNISNFNPNMSQINSFVAGEMQFTAGGMITLPNGTVWGGELNNLNVYHTTDPRSPNYDPYGHWSASTVAGVLQNMGDSISAGGIVLIGTGVGAGIGSGMMTVGGIISQTGTGVELLVDIYGNTWESFDGQKWIVKGSIEAVNYIAGTFKIPEGAEAYYNALSISTGRWFDYMRDLRSSPQDTSQNLPLE